MIPTKEEMRQALEKRQGKELQQHFFAATVGICGLGGLGSNIAISLARAGVGKLILIDFDKVDVTNLHRQQYKASQIGRYKTEALSENLKEIAPYVELETHTTRMTEQNVVELLKEADVICEAFDDAQVLHDAAQLRLFDAYGQQVVDTQVIILKKYGIIFLAGCDTLPDIGGKVFATRGDAHIHFGAAQNTATARIYALRHGNRLVSAADHMNDEPLAHKRLVLRENGRPGTVHRHHGALKRPS